MKMIRRLISVVVTLSLILTLSAVVMAANGGTVTSLKASASNTSVHVSGTTDQVKAGVTVEVLQGTKIIGMQTFSVKNGSFSGDIVIGSAYDENGASLTVRAADSDGGTWTKLENVPIDAAILKGYNLSLDEKIGVAFYVELSDELKNNDTKITFTFDGLVNYMETQEVYFADAKEVDHPYRPNSGIKYYKFPCYVTAADMTVPINATLTNGDTEIAFAPFCVRDYAQYIVDNYPYDSTWHLAKALLNYGYYAQVKFADSTIRFEEDKMDLENPPTSLELANVNTPNGVTYRGSSVVFLSGNRIRHYFTIDDDTATFTINGTPVTPIKSGNMYFIATDILSVTQLNDPIEVVITCSGQEPVSFTYSAMNYVKAVLEPNSGASAAMVNLAKAFYMYYSAAESYYQHA